MAAPNYGRVRATPAHVRGHDNPVPVVVGGGVGVGTGLVRAALGGDDKPAGGKAGVGVGGLKPVPPGVSIAGEFGRPKGKPKGSGKAKKLTA